MQENEAQRLRYGYTTGSCATAATVAALSALLNQEAQQTVTIVLPSEDSATFTVEECFVDSRGALCGVRKDAGDDPDVTDGLIIRSEVTIRKDIPRGTVLFLQGEGVGRVTLSGLGIPVGEPAVNPVPRHMIMRAVRSLLKKYRVEGGVAVTLSIPGGKEVAKRTMNEKVGVVDGLSIIGTSGIVVPYSEEAYIESIRRSLRVALYSGCRDVAIVAGARSEKHLKKLLPDFPDQAFVHYGNRIGVTLEIIRECAGFESVTVSVMLAKATKLAQGELDLSSRNVAVNRDFIAGLARSAGYDNDICHSLLDISLVRNIVKSIPFRKGEPFYRELSRECYRVCGRLVPGIRLAFVLMNSDGICIVRNALDEK
ncbi:cobalamin biosynthesis protein CbiD [Prosthecochloris marina]|uniref:Cobalt-precorrin-5B C(1)-methyltransferase n=1 Tax=Prosthecochloris marina TaxID=2017681 RepID=A0A317TBU8_9CHLB|nr:cobalt-precorrin-5B (C(1))-methyltransferase CbiD [Prosthecochloris marina]PWW83276.1 cobalamin biosynthesis protein CbiD [Prosthecochloris marina]